MSCSYNGICFKIRISCLSHINLEGCISERKVLFPRRKKEWKVFLDLQCSGSSFTVVPRIPIVKWLAAFDLPCVYFHISVFSTHRKYEQLLEKHFSSNKKNSLRIFIKIFGDTDVQFIQLTLSLVVSGFVTTF